MSTPYPTLFALLLFFPVLNTAQTFTDLPGPMGTTRCFLKSEDGLIYLGSNSKGVFKSANSGQNWTGLGGNTIMTGRINDLAFDTSGQIIAATEQGGIKFWDGTAWINHNTGLFTACGITIPIRTIAVDTQGRVYAGAHGYSACFPNGDLYQLKNGSWTSIASGLQNTNINRLSIHPITGVLYAGTDAGVFKFEGNSWTGLNLGLSDSIIHTLSFAPNGDLFAGTNLGVSRLKHNELIWEPLFNGLSAEPVFSIAIDQDATHILIGTGYNQEQVGSLYGHLFESTDSGNHWTQIAPDVQSTVLLDLAFIDDTTYLAAGWGVFKSEDQGKTWKSANTGFSAKTFNTQGRLAVSDSPVPTLFYGSDDGVFRSTDQGQSWSMASQGLSRHIVTLLKADHYGNLFCSVMRYLGENSVGFGDGLLYKSTDNGDHWYPVVISKDWRYMEISELPDGTLICAHGFGAQPPSATYIGSSLARSTDHGETWSDLNVQSGMAFCCAADSSGNLFVAGESQSVYRSSDGGNNFELIVAPGQEGNVGTLEVSPTGDLLMGSGGQRTLFFSTDHGSNYVAFNSPVLPDYRGVSEVIFDKQGIAYCTTTGQSGVPSMFTVTPPFNENSIFTPVAGLFGSLFKMVWDECGYLYIYRGGGILKSDLPLRDLTNPCLSGVEQNFSPPKLDIFPNPTPDLLHIQGENLESGWVELWSIRGEKVFETRFYKHADYSLKALPNGIYWLKFFRDNGILINAKLVKN